MGARNEVEAAYFTLLRAREELDILRRYGEFLEGEEQRLRRFRVEGEALADAVDRRLVRNIRATDEPLRRALDARLAVVADERRRLPDRISAAEAFVAECEADHEQLKRSA